MAPFAFVVFMPRGARSRGPVHTVRHSVTLSHETIGLTRWRDEGILVDVGSLLALGKENVISLLSRSEARSESIIFVVQLLSEGRLRSLVGRSVCPQSIV